MTASALLENAARVGALGMRQGLEDEPVSSCREINKHTILCHTMYFAILNYTVPCYTPAAQDALDGLDLVCFLLGPRARERMQPARSANRIGNTSLKTCRAEGKFRGSMWVAPLCTPGSAQWNRNETVTRFQYQEPGQVRRPLVGTLSNK